ncbi:unnamed protein product [Vitrella brassicaformis CCMP3155]|uniref:Tyrosine-protein phosphatase domain-containing protein n=2 Tax=Vitrella brassicaformis TaxID=1169539 RepID=A0A0G4EZV4_VITBC|nr:unnamed protein product [Vitrella brassicaformis CCMP3155]|eukprot:CEM05160.1 unnamed protein product [Vitrella brassicaformis CCMP3155]
MTSGSRFSFFVHFDNQRTHQAKLHAIDEGFLYIGGEAAGKDAHLLREHRITHILVVHHSIQPVFEDKFKYLVCPVKDMPEELLYPSLVKALPFIGEAKQKGGRVLVLCGKGVSRSASVLIAQLMSSRQMTYKEAFDELLKIRQVYPNIGFQVQLHQMDRALQARREEGADADTDGDVASLLQPMDMTAYQLQSLIQDEVSRKLEETASVVERLFSEPHVLHQASTWRRFGVFYEGLKSYRVQLMGHNEEERTKSEAIVTAAKQVAKRLTSLKAVYSESLEGVRLAASLAQEINLWLAQLTPHPTPPPYELGDSQELISLQQQPPRKDCAAEPDEPPQPPSGKKKRLDVEVVDDTSEANSDSEADSSSDRRERERRRERKARKKEKRERKRARKEAKRRRREEDG